MLRLAILLTTIALSLAPARADDEKICFSIGTTDYEDKNYWQVGLAACERVMASSRKLNDVQKSAYYKQMADWKRRMGDLNAAIADFGAAAALNPRDHEIFDYRGDTWVALGNDKMALEDYNKAISIKPAYPAAYLGRAEVFKRDGNLAGAEAEYRKVLSRPTVDRIDEWAHGEARRRLEELKKGGSKNNG
ncbi:MAG: tetratricopeptide repeat protein [Rhabdaerophilum sp.]